MSAPADIRVCFVGDSFIAGIGDPDHRGWVGRVLTQAAANGTAISAYNLGIRRDTSADVAKRWAGECARRLPQGCEPHVVFSFGVNDTMIEAGQTRVSAQGSVKYLQEVLGVAQSLYKLAVIGPPPIADTAQNLRIRSLSEQFSDICRALKVPYLPVFESLHENPIWMQQVAANDGAHPQAEGYAQFAGLVVEWEHWWFRSLAS